MRSRTDRWARTAVAAALTAFLLPPGGPGCGSPDEGLRGGPPFRRMLIDAQPPGGPDCCTDVGCLGDINGDGYVDVVIGAENASAAGLVWYAYPTWRRHPVATGQFTTDGRTTDVDGDGDTDIVTCDHGSGIYWYENPSDEDAQQWNAHLVGPGYAHDVETADLDGDGDLDIVTCDKQRVVVWERTGKDAWRALEVSARPGEGIALADLDADGNLDVIYGASWLEARVPLAEGAWAEHTIDPGWHSETRVRAADLNADGRLDVVLSVSESDGPLAWFEAPPDPVSGPWRRHDIAPGPFTGVHSLQVADFDLDGDPDVAMAEMHTSAKQRVLLFLKNGESWQAQTISRAGSHNLQVADIDADGDVDMVGKNFGGPERPVEWWENLTAPSDWVYFAADDRRPRDQLEKTGLVFTDVDRDGDHDIVAGSYFYRNPGAAITTRWDRTRLPDNVDVYFAAEVDGDRACDLVGVSGNALVWIESKDSAATTWEVRSVGSVPEGRTQGYTEAQIVAGGKPELVFTRGKALSLAQLPTGANESGPWPIAQISAQTEEEGVAAGDIDRDGDVDVAAVFQDGHQVIWLENPGESGEIGGSWRAHVIGPSPTGQWLDRVAVADVDGDSRPDVIVTEETQDWEYNAHIYWFRAPADAAGGTWTRHAVTLLRSVNSMDVADMDGDGDVDIVAAEHTDQHDADGAPDNLTAVFENVDGGKRWIVRPVDVSSHSSHLGARLCDLDGDGDLDMASIAWWQYEFLHVWLNAAGR